MTKSNRTEQHDEFLQMLMNQCLREKATAADFGNVLRYMEKIGLIAEIAATVVQNPEGAQAAGIRGLVGRLPFAREQLDEQDEDPEALVG